MKDNRDVRCFFFFDEIQRIDQWEMFIRRLFYTIDTGLLNAMTLRNSSDFGPLLENLVFMQLRNHGFQVAYVTTSEGYETDFLARHRITGEIKLIQVCWDMSKDKTFQREIRGLKGAMEDLDIQSGTVVTWDDQATLANGIQILPAWKWLLAPAES